MKELSRQTNEQRGWGGGRAGPGMGLLSDHVSWNTLRREAMLKGGIESGPTTHLRAAMSESGIPGTFKCSSLNSA